MPTLSDLLKRLFEVGCILYCADQTEFRSVAVLVIGASSTGKSHTVLGTEPKAAKTGAAVDPGLVARTVTLLGDLYPDEKITLSAYELDGQARRQVLCEEDLSSPPAVRSAIATIRKNVKTTPKAVTGGDASQMRSSSRACTHLELVRLTFHRRKNTPNRRSRPFREGEWTFMVSSPDTLG